MVEDWRVRGWRSVRHGARLLEAGMLGRGHASAERVVDHAIRLGADRQWCMRCGAAIDAVSASAMSGPVPLGRGPTCGACSRSPAFDAFVRLGRYDSPLGRLARRVKRQAWHRAAALLGARLAMEVRDRLQPPSDGWCVVPVPATLLRRLARGIDHTYALALAMSSALDAPLVRALAVGTASRQAGLDRTQRLSRRSSMRTRRRACRVIRGRSVLLVDDVRTTGSTLLKARELLEEAGAAIVVPAVICVAERRKRMRGMNLQDRPISASGPECRELVHIQNPLKEGC